MELENQKTIYFVGCSYTWGAGLEFEYYNAHKGWSIDKINKENDMSVNRLENGTYHAAEYRRKNRFGNLVAKHFNVNHEVLNVGNGGNNGYTIHLIQSSTISVAKILIVQLSFYGRSWTFQNQKKFHTEKYINSGNTYITDNFSKEDLLNECHTQIWNIYKEAYFERKEKNIDHPQIYFIAWHKEFGEVLKNKFSNHFIPIHIDGIDYNSFEDTSLDFNNPNIKHKYNMRLCDILDGCPDTHLSSIGHKIVADSIIKKIKNEYI